MKTSEDALRDAAPKLYRALVALVEIDRRFGFGRTNNVGHTYHEECRALAREAIMEAQAAVPEGQRGPARDG